MPRARAKQSVGDLDAEAKARLVNLLGFVKEISMMSSKRADGAILGKAGSPGDGAGGLVLHEVSLRKLLELRCADERPALWLGSGEGGGNEPGAWMRLRRPDAEGTKTSAVGKQARRRRHLLRLGVASVRQQHAVSRADRRALPLAGLRGVCGVILGTARGAARGPRRAANCGRGPRARCVAPPAHTFGIRRGREAIRAPTGACTHRATS